MNRELQEKIQAWVDGELSGPESHQIAALTRSNAEAHALAENLRGFRQLLQGHEPSRKLDASRDFYWSGIRRGIEAAERAQAPATAPRNPPRWLTWLIPGTLVATAALFALRPGSIPNPDPASDTSRPPMIVDHEVESSLPDVSTLTFYSSNDAMTVVWVGTADIL